MASVLHSSSALSLINAIPIGANDALVRLHFRGGEAVCTGFFVNPTTIITAAHCLYSGAKELWKVSDVSISNDAIISVEAVSLVPHPEYKVGENSGNDVGIIRTSAVEESAPFKISTDRPGLWGTAELLGAGKVDLVSGAYGRSKGTAFYIRFGSFMYMLGKSKKTESPGQSVTIAPNDSGGPILDPKSGKVVAVGTRTTVGLTKGTFLPAVSMGTLLTTDKNRAFIAQAIK